MTPLKQSYKDEPQEDTLHIQQDHEQVTQCNTQTVEVDQDSKWAANNRTRRQGQDTEKHTLSGNLADKEDVANEHAFWAERTAKRRADRAERRQRKAVAISQCDLVNAGGKSFFTADDEGWEDVWIFTLDNTSEGDDDEDDSE
ncbi:hypothetical protein TRIUR3_11430 [Triticum urartu]|uniref:Uncharacterized protein n=1 Tax=Triticum urartu TaxID=4572 RepID=M7ZZN8_TRIUA|nr:hypothetical protein TRIUR3_11430 [Triticum urartu]